MISQHTKQDYTAQNSSLTLNDTMALDETKKLPADVHAHVAGLIENITPETAGTVVSAVKTIIDNHLEYQEQLTKETWEGFVGTYKG